MNNNTIYTTFFPSNKYAKWYLNIIQNRLDNPLDSNIYTEKHHIIPKSFYKYKDIADTISLPWDSDHNDTQLVALSIKEHFICHLLLSKMYPKHTREKHLMDCAITYFRVHGKYKYSRLVEAATTRHRDKCNKYVKETNIKISNTLKSKWAEGIYTLSDEHKARMHSPEAIAKASATMKAKQYRSYYDPITLDYKMFSKQEVDGLLVPDGWLPGRKPKYEHTPIPISERLLNKKRWVLYKNDSIIWAGLNFTEFLKSRPDLKSIKYSPSKSKKVKKFDYMPISNDNGLVQVNYTCTNMSQKEYAKHIDVSGSTLSNSIKNGTIKKLVKVDYYILVEDK